VSETAARKPLHLLLSCLYWSVPALLSLWLFQRGLWCWFHRDDFALLLLVQLPDHQFWAQFWQPRAQGTFRPLSERLFFYYFYHWFGLNAFPYRLLAFATLIVNLWLVALVTRRLTGKHWAGFAAACLWGVHHSLATSMAWSSAYNQMMCTFFLLLSFWLFLQFISTGNWIYYGTQWVTFLLGFGALEAIVVYPAILLAYVVAEQRRYWPHVVPMLFASGGLAWLQLQAAPPPTEGLYQASYGFGLIEGLGVYTKWALAGEAKVWVAVVLAGLLLAFAAWRALQKDWRGLFFVAWFVGALAPYLPLAAHRSRYYLVIPFLGLAMLGGWALVEACHRGWRYRLVGLASLALFLPPTIEYATDNLSYDYRWSIAARNLLSGVSQARAKHPNKTILLTNVSPELFYVAIYHQAFQVISVYDVYLTPDQPDIHQMGGYEPIDRFFLSREETLRVLALNRAVVYDAAGPRLKEITRSYAALAPLKL
jgi:Dolichyl-phosphate-mannose-protein mannosyltransferase